MRPAIPIADIQKAVELIKAAAPNCVVFVDNCYGEFAEEREPTAVGADLVAGSLIKSPGGTVAPCGGYIVGRVSHLPPTHPPTWWRARSSRAPAARWRRAAATSSAG
jgi:cystathionine beta-lyase family protein involved in aluminum resistance